MALTIETIQATEGSEALFDLLSAELQRLLPDEVQEDPELFRRTVENLPRGLRAMSGMYSFDVSMSCDDLAWHFGNQNDEWDLKETLDGLRELELYEVADLFEQAWNIMGPHLEQLRRSEISADRFHDWLVTVGAQEKINPMNEFIWAYCERAGAAGLLESWPVYARKYPERCVVAEA